MSLEKTLGRKFQRTCLVVLACVLGVGMTDRESNNSLSTEQGFIPSVFKNVVDRFDMSDERTIRVKIFPHSKNYLPHLKDRVTNYVKVTSELPCSVYLIDSVKGREIYIGRSDSFSLSYSKMTDRPMKFECDASFKVKRAYGLPSYSYSGDLYVYKDKSTRSITLVNQVELEAYLRGVVPSEVYVDWPLAVLEAQAVAARTYAVYHKRQSERSYREAALFDVDDTILYQAYTGLDRTNEKTDLAIENTTGQILKHKGKVIQAYYHADSGGVTEDARAVWNGSGSSYALGRVEPYFDGKDKQKSSKWNLKVDLSELTQSLQRDGVLSYDESVKDVIISQRTRKSKRVKGITIVTNDKSYKLSYRDFSQYVNFPSALFNLSLRKSQGQMVVSGFGFGHGVGLSQQGGKYLAETKKWSSAQILKFYYNRVNICKLVTMNKSICIN